MAEEAQATTTVQETANPIVADGQQTTDIINEPSGASHDSEGYDSLFGESVSEAELMGESDEQGETGAEGDAGATEEPEAQPAAEEEGQGQQEEKTLTDEAAAEPQDEDTGSRPPAGYVPLQALHEERGRRQQLAERVQQLEQYLQQQAQQPKPPAPQEAPKDEFKVLDEAEFDELVEEDPAEAIRYQARFAKHQAQQAERARIAQTEQQELQRALNRLETRIPGFYDPTAGVQAKLSDFAINLGFDPDALAAITDPRTKIIPPGATQPIPLGERAVSVIEAIHKGYSQVANTKDEKTLRASIEKELRDSITKEVTQQLLTKIKQQNPGYVSIGETPSGEATVPGQAQTLTEAQYAKLSPAERAKLLGA